jgi:predicted ATP-dependent protease
MIEGLVNPFSDELIHPETIGVIGCSESLTGIYDAYAAACHVGLINSVFFSYRFSENSIKVIKEKKLYLMGDSLSLSVFICIALSALHKKNASLCVATGAIHRENGGFVCNPVSHIEQKLILAATHGISRMYIPEENLKNCTSRTRRQLDIIPLPRDLNHLVEKVVREESLP